MDKADYVRSQGQSRIHHCHWPGCQVQVPPAMWGCRRHWFTLPHYLRSKVWKAYVPGQEISMTPSDEYLEVAAEVQAWIATFERQGQGAKSIGKPKERKIPRHRVTYREATFGSLKVGSHFKAARKLETWWVKCDTDHATYVNGGGKTKWELTDSVWIVVSGGGDSAASL